MSDQSTSTTQQGTALERIATTLELAIVDGEAPRASQLSRAERIHLSRRIADEVTTVEVFRELDERALTEQALTILTTVGTVRDATVGRVARYLKSGMMPLSVHHLLMFADALKITPDYARLWLRYFDVDLADDESIEAAIDDTKTAINGWCNRAASEEERKLDRNSDVIAIIDALRSAAEARVITDLERLAEAYD